ncbi:MAG: DUF554 domain-containing protein [Planctomycetes bacterium]|nr:DUF554 domain-containing protein [Planctomycetota bacterium]
MWLAIFADVTCIFLGGLLGTYAGRRMPDKIREGLLMTFSLASMTMGITNMVKMVHLPVVILALLLGMIAGTLLNLEKCLRHVGEWAASVFMRGHSLEAGNRARSLEYFAIAVILFCAGPTGIFGVMRAAIGGDTSLLYSKCFLDIFTAAIFAASAGIVICLLSVPVVIVFSTFALVAGLIAPYITPAMLADFSGCGGVLVLAVGFRMAEIKMFHVTDMLPALLFVMPLSSLWVILPF